MPPYTIPHSFLNSTYSIVHTEEKRTIEAAGTKGEATAEEDKASMRQSLGRVRLGMAVGELNSVFELVRVVLRSSMY